jgi:FMN-dependent NADH-azoreductase
LQSAVSNIASITGQLAAQASNPNPQLFDVDINQMQQDIATIDAQMQAANVPAQAAQLYTQANQAAVGLLEQLGQSSNQLAFQQGLAQYQTPEYNAAETTVAQTLKGQCPNLTF